MGVLSLSVCFVVEKERFDFGPLLLVTGINSVIKGFPWYDPKMLDPNRWDQLEEWGFNAVREGRLKLKIYTFSSKSSCFST